MQHSEKNNAFSTLAQHINI